MGKKAYFLSDLHLGARFRIKSDETPHALEKRVVAFLDSIKADASEIYMLGDILDYWFEYKHVVPKGFVRFFGKLAELADAGIKITWLIGNHDIWIFDYLPSELGIEVIDGVLECEIFGVPFSMQHGDAIGGTPKFQIMRSLFRNKWCQKLYSGIHPRWTVGFAFACSRKSRMKEALVGEWPKNLLDGIRQWCRKEISEGNKSRYFVFGHLHGLHVEKLPEDRELVVLGAWPDKGCYGVFDGRNFSINHADPL